MGKGGDGEVLVGDKKEVLIDGRLYDVTNLKHPEGNVINFYAGKNIDASQAFTNFHIRSKKAKKYLDSLPSRDAKKEPDQITGQTSLLEDFDKLTRELEAEGFFKPNIPHVIFRLTELILLHVVGYFLFTRVNLFAGIAVLGIASGRCGWLMHEGGHYSLTGLFFIFVFIYKLCKIQ
jgi:hypothetical protein